MVISIAYYNKLFFVAIKIFYCNELIFVVIKIFYCNIFLTIATIINGRDMAII